jgi:SAM-dependent methyltransferase
MGMDAITVSPGARITPRSRTRWRAIIKGALTYVPGANWVLPKPSAGNRPPASYFYGVWMKHLAYLSAGGFPIPQTVAELGPGDTLGLGICALLSGARRYYGLDIVPHTNRAQNLPVLDELADMFARRVPRPVRGWPDFGEYLDAREFLPRLTESARALDPERLRRLRQALLEGASEDLAVMYRVPWSSDDVVEESSVDLVISQAVLEHVRDIRETYASLHRWLKPGAIMSHQIDFRSHDLADEWDGHRGISEGLWSVMLGRRPYLINREPWSAHASAITDAGFKIIRVMLLKRTDGIARASLAPRWRSLSNEDFTCAEAFVQAQKI